VLTRRAAALRPSAWRISTALAVCFLVVDSALHTVLQGFGWWFAMGGVILAVLGAAALARAVGIRPWVPTLVGSLVLLGILTVFFAARTAFLFVVPTLETLGQFGDLGQAGALSISGQSVPADPTFGILFLLCLGSGALAVVADLMAVTWRLPALTAVPLAVVLGIPAFIGIELSDAFVFVLAAVAWLVLLRAGQPFAQTGRAIGIGATAIVLALLAPLVLPQVDESQASGDSFGGYLASVNPVLDLGEDLRRQLPRTILTYSTLSGDPTYLRLVSLQNFTAETWEPDPPTIDRNNVPSAVGPPPGLAQDVRADSETTWVDVSNLGSPWLPVPYPVTGVSGLRGDWFWDADDLTFTSPNRDARGEEYRASSLAVRPTPAQLAAAGSVVPGAYGKYLALPSGLPAIIADTAREVTASATSDYGKAVALQEYFRDGAFGYSETAPVEQGYDGSGMEVIATFLEVKSGYCIHFASAMAVMARTLGIPSRVAVGLLPGEAQAELDEGRTSYRVTTRDVHAWPELYFEGIGWTRFEPTPGRGFVPTYADEATPGVPIPPATTPSASPTPTPTAAPTSSAAPLDPNDSSSSPGGATSWLGWLWAALVVLGALLLLLAPAIVRTVQRRIRMRRLARGSPATATGWRELLQTAEDLGLDIGGTATPREAARLIARAARLGDSDAALLASALDAVERESFARPATATGAGADAAAGVVRISRRLRSVAGMRVRVLAALAPRSIWSRLAGLVGLPAAQGARTAALSRVG
jgi:transglutaminase-like putative cysteine protease